MCEDMSTHLLFRLRACAWPFHNDVLFCLGAGSKSECDAGEGGALEIVSMRASAELVYNYKVDADDQLGLTPAVLLGVHTTID